MKFRCLCMLMTFLLMVALTSCSNKKHVSESAVIVLNESDYLNADVVSTDENIIFYKKTAKFSEEYKGVKLKDISHIQKPKNAYIQAVDDNGNIYYCIDGNDSVDTIAEIMSYNLKSQKLTSLIKPVNMFNCTVVSVNDRYLIWVEDENANWQKTSIHLFDLQTKDDVEFYKHTLDPKTNLTYTSFFNSPVMIGDKVYFDDVVSKDSNDIYKIQVFSYDIKQKKVSKLYDQAKIPMEYKGKLAWLSMSADKKNSVFCSDAARVTGILKSETRLGTAYTSSGDLIIINDYMSHALFNEIKNKSKSSKGNSVRFVDTTNDPSISSYGIKLVTGKQILPILVVENGFATNVVTNGNIIGWYGSSIGAPMFYDRTKDKIICIDNLKIDKFSGYGITLSKNYAIIGYSEDTEDATEQTLLWTLNETE